MSLIPGFGPVWVDDVLGYMVVSDTKVWLQEFVYCVVLYEQVVSWLMSRLGLDWVEWKWLSVVSDAIQCWVLQMWICAQA